MSRARLRAARPARSSTSRATSSTRSASPEWTGAVTLPPRRRSTHATWGPYQAGNKARVDPAHRRELKRYGVPAAFLLAATIAVLLVKSGLNDSESSATPTTAPNSTAQTTTSQTTTKLVLTGTGTGATT